MQIVKEETEKNVVVTKPGWTSLLSFCRIILKRKRGRSKFQHNHFIVGSPPASAGHFATGIRKTCDQTRKIRKRNQINIQLQYFIQIKSTIPKDELNDSKCMSAGQNFRHPIIKLCNRKKAEILVHS